MSVLGFILFQCSSAMLIPKAQLAESNSPTLVECARKMKVIEGFQSEIEDLEARLELLQMFGLENISGELIIATTLSDSMTGKRRISHKRSSLMEVAAAIRRTFGPR